MIDTNVFRKRIIDLAVSGKINEHSHESASDELSSIINRLGNCDQRVILPEEKWIDIPKNWTWGRLADLTTNDSLNDGNWVLSEDMVPSGDVKLIQLGSIGDCEYRYKGFKYLTEEHFRELNGKQIYPGYLIINRLVVDKMLACLIPEINGILITAVDVCWVAPNDELFNIEYLMYVMASTGVQQRVKDMGHGVTRFRISKLNLIDIAFPLPPLVEQKQIVKRINELFSILNSIDNLQQKYEYDREILKGKIIDAGIRGKLTQQMPEDGNADDLYAMIQEEKDKLIKEGKIKKEKPLPEISDDEIPFEIPNNWKWCRIGEACNVLMGQSPDGTNVGCVINGIEFHQGKIYFGDKYLNRSKQKTSEITRVAEADSVLLCVRAPIGIVNITEREICIGRGLCALKTLSNMPSDFLYYYLKLCRKQLEKFGTGSTFSAITVNVVKNFVIPLPPLDEQKRIVEKINSIFDVID